ncbi:MAG: HPr family phosphocarrier protein [Desulfobacterales bacterium]|nr:HPr family phosphocarrier protein [Desulfobacterales bacterium]MBF0395333.1 HPr family phosphocarrier protein [Desulfobacterales bacterium]
MQEDGFFNERIVTFSDDYLKCCKYISTYDTPKRDNFTKMFYSRLTYSSHLLEDFLDFHGAKNNSSWYFYRELSAAIRHLSSASYCQKHILARLDFYGLPDTEEFEKNADAVLDFLSGCLIKMSPIIISESIKLNISIPEDSFKKEHFQTSVTSDTLTYDIYDENRDQHKKHIVRIANDFLAISKNFDEIEFFEPYHIEKIKTIVPEKINEVEIRRYEMLVHNLQSYFDTYVIHGGYMVGNHKLKKFRSYFSIVFHLLQMMGSLLHFYERHLHEVGYKDIYKKVQSKLSEIIDPDKLLDHTINFGLYYVCNFLSEGKDLAKIILNENIERGSVTVSVPKSGFHMRPSLLVTKIVEHYGGQVELCIGNDRFDASSLLDMQWAGGKIQKENLSNVLFEGDIRTLKDLQLLSSINYCEDIIGKGISMPKELNYLS